MVLVLTLLVVAVLFGIGFAVHLLWWIAIAALLLWLIGFFLGRGGSEGRHGFYRW